MDSENDPIAFDRKTGERIVKAVRAVEGTAIPQTSHGTQKYGYHSFVKRGTLDASLTATGTATVSLSKWSGSAWSDSGDNQENVRSGIPNIDTISSGKVVWITFLGGDWFVISAEC